VAEIKITEINPIDSARISLDDSTLILDETDTRRITLQQFLAFITSSVFDSLTVNSLTASVSSSITPSDIPNSALINSYITINGVNVELGDSTEVGTITYITPGDGIQGGGGGAEATIAVDNTVIRTSGGQTITGTLNITNTLSGVVAQFTSYEGDGSGLTNLTASNISNFQLDVRSQFSAGTNITIVDGVISSTATGGGGSTPGGPEYSLQFNSGSELSGSGLLTYNYDTNILSGTLAEFTSVTASLSGDGTNINSLRIGTPDDGDYTDGLFVDFDSDTKVSNAIDRINILLKGIAPSAAPDLSNLERSVAGGTSMKLAFGDSQTVSGYTNVTASLTDLADKDFTEIFSVTNGPGGRPIRLGVFSSLTSLTFTLNNNVTADGSPFQNYPNDAFNVAATGIGSYTLEVNGIDVTPTGSTTDTSSYSANNFILSLANTASFATTGAGFDTFRHRTGTVSVPTSEWRVGHNYAKITHVSSLGTHETNYVDWVYDPAATNGGGEDYSFTGTTSGSFTVSGQKNLSGIKYYTSCTYTFDTTINNYYKYVYPTTANGGITFSGLTSGLSAAAFASTPDPTLPTDTLSRSSLHTVGTTRVLGTALSSTMNINNGLGKTSSESLTTETLLLDKVNTSNTDLVENFCLENYRVPSASYDTQVSLSSALFDSVSPLSASDLVVYNGAMRYPTQTLNGGDVAGATVDSIISGQPDYSSATEDRYYFRKFVNGGSAKAVLNFAVTGQNVNFASYNESLTGNAVQIWIKVPGKTGWRDITVAAPANTIGIETNDNVGCLQGTAPSDIGSSATTRTFVLNLLTEGLEPSEVYVFRVLTSANWAGNISKLQVS
jgi:hypothetical protein